MTYATAQDLLDRYSALELAQLADQSAQRLVDATLLALTITSGDRTSYSAEAIAAADAALARINRMLDDADGTIDKYLEGRYQLPLAVVPRGLLRAACEIARFYLYDNQPSDHVKALYESTLKWLEQVGKGVISLGATASGEQPVANDGAQIESDGRVFGRGDSSGFI